MTPAQGRVDEGPTHAPDGRVLSLAEREVYGAVLAAFALPVAAREWWFTVVAVNVAATSRALGWNGRTID